ncbi:MAG: UDP-N-acetylmuramoyl-tripeptide--D-alanyl-D-alanine ligase [Tissierellia bacterium]|nr:UDP-N-acetylmuramoyl-tripeptide--D-alanyl-D-alanine ligase [Tissierellia bacterium]
MIIRSLKEIEKMVTGFGLKEKFKNINIEGVSTDSRQTKYGQLFIPLIGEKFNGHKFIGQAIEKGAVASLWNKDEPIPDIDFPFILVEDTLKALQILAKEYMGQLSTKVIGITGSNGKTSTKDILASLLSTKFKTQKTKGNFNNFIGLPLTILDLDEDTEMAVLEMGTDKFGEISLLTSIAKPDIAIITNIGEAHLDDLITKDNVAKAKLEILEGLAPDGLFVYYGDDPVLKRQVKNMEIKQKILTYGLEKSNDYQYELINADERGIAFKLKSPDEEEFFLPMLGKHNMHNAVAAIMVARYLGISYPLIRQGLNKVEKTGMRNELIQAQGFSILNDSYKSNPSSVLAALDTLYSMKEYGQKIVVLGDMLGIGKEEVELHKEIGRKIDPSQVDYLFTIGPLAEHISETAKANFGEDRVIICSSKGQVVERIKEIIKPNALILVKASRPLELEEVVYQLERELILTKDKVV